MNQHGAKAKAQARVIPASYHGHRVLGFFRNLDFPQTDGMKVYYFDNAEGDQRMPHLDESLPILDENTLRMIRVEYRFIPVDQDGNWEQVSGDGYRRPMGLNRVAKGNRTCCPGKVLQESRRDRYLEGWSRRCLRVQTQNIL